MARVWAEKKTGAEEAADEKAWQRVDSRLARERPNEICIFMRLYARCHPSKIGTRLFVNGSNGRKSLGTVILNSLGDSSETPAVATAEAKEDRFTAAFRPARQGGLFVIIFQPCSFGADQSVRERCEVLNGGAA